MLRVDVVRSASHSVVRGLCFDQRPEPVSHGEGAWFAAPIGRWVCRWGQKDADYVHPCMYTRTYSELSQDHSDNIWSVYNEIVGLTEEVVTKEYF